MKKKKKKSLQNLKRMLRYFHRVWHRWQRDHHGRETEQKETRANMKHHFSGTKWTGGLCRERQTDRGHEWNVSPTWPEVSFRYFLVWRECLPCLPHPLLPCPLLSSPLLSFSCLMTNQPPLLSLAIHVTKFTGKAAGQADQSGVYPLWLCILYSSADTGKNFDFKKATFLTTSLFAIRRHWSFFLPPELELSKLFSTLMITDRSTDKEKGV